MHSEQSDGVHNRGATFAQLLLLLFKWEIVKFMMNMNNLIYKIKIMYDHSLIEQTEC